jgi:hypothetical protein
MATECFKIEWTGYYSFNKATSRPEANKLGLYAIYKPTFDEKNLLYVGKATKIGTRLNQHRQALQRLSSPEEVNELQIAIGVLTLLDGKSANQGQLKDIESLFINRYKPERNAPSTKKGYTGRSALVVSTGKTGRFNKLTTHDKTLSILIKDSIISDYDLY